MTDLLVEDESEWTHHKRWENVDQQVQSQVHCGDKGAIAVTTKNEKYTEAFGRG